MDVTDEPAGLVLLHGAELGAWLWDDVLPLLRAPAVAVDLPGRGGGRDVRLGDAVRAVVEAAAGLPGPVVLVAHSASGVLVPGAAAALGERLTGLVLLGAAVPRRGRSWLDGQPFPVRPLLRALYRAKPDGMLSPAGDVRRALTADLDAAATARVMDRRRAEAPGWLTERVPEPFPAVPALAVVLTEDHAVRPDAQRAQYARLSRAEVVELPTGHLPMLADPPATAALLDQAAARG